MTDRDELDELLADARLLLDAELSARRPPLDLEPDDDLALAFEPDPEFAELNADARLLLDGLLERRGAARPMRPRQRSRFVAVAAAASVLLGLAGAAYASKRWQELSAAAESERFAAAAIAELDHAWLSDSDQAQLSARLAPSWVIPATPVPVAPPAVVDAESDDASGPLEPAPELDAAERLALLDAEAYALLRASEYEQAARRFRTIVKIGGSSEYAELAFGELFALARRDGDDELDELWPAYLKRFPRGRYADAARAGLCRRTPEQSERACWTDYLLKHPRGAARSEALRETQDD